MCATTWMCVPGSVRGGRSGSRSRGSSSRPGPRIGSPEARDSVLSLLSKVVRGQGTATPSHSTTPGEQGQPLRGPVPHHWGRASLLNSRSPRQQAAQRGVRHPPKGRAGLEQRRGRGGLPAKAPQ